MFRPTDEAFVEAVIDRLDESYAPVLFLHKQKQAPPDCVLMTMDFYDKLVELVPVSDEADRMFMNHDHIEGST